MYLGLNCPWPKCPSAQMLCPVCVSSCVCQGQFVSEYVGDLINEQEARRRLTEAYRNNVSNFYMMSLDSARWVNNCISNMCCKYCWIFSLSLDVKITSLVNILVQKHKILYCIWRSTCEHCKWQQFELPKPLCSFGYTAGCLRSRRHSASIHPALYLHCKRCVCQLKSLTDQHYKLCVMHDCDVEDYWCWSEGQLVSLHEQQLWAELRDTEVDCEWRLAYRPVCHWRHSCR